jgi:hypothetical protein
LVTSDGRRKPPGPGRERKLRAVKVTAEEILILAERAEQAGQMALAGVLHCLIGAVHSGLERPMLNALMPFARESITAIDRHLADQN